MIEYKDIEEEDDELDCCDECGCYHSHPSYYHDID
jgi:hypothetical protein